MTTEDRNWLEERFQELNELITKLRVDVAVLKVKAGIWGLIGGCIPIIAYLLIKRIQYA